MAIKAYGPNCNKFLDEIIKNRALLKNIRSAHKFVEKSGKK